MTLSTATTNRAYSAHAPKWQQFQTSLLVPSTQSAAASKKSSEPSEAPYPYQRQYSHVYHQRLKLLGPRCWETVEKECKDDKVTRVQRVLELRENVLAIAVGTLVREKTPDDNKQLHPQSTCRETDELYLEDESGRVHLEFPSHGQHLYCSGIVLGLQGTVGVDGVLRVERVYPPALPPPVSSPAPTNDIDNAKQDPHILLISGLDCGSSEQSSLTRDMLVSFLQGSLGAVSQAANISHIICAGGLVASPGENFINSAVNGCRELDGFCYQVAVQAGIPMTILPGKEDPTTANWPQRPLHKSLLPRTTAKAKNKVFFSTPNPYAAVHAAGEKPQYVAGSDGTNIQDLTQHLLESKCSEDGNNEVEYKPLTELKALQKTLEWGHICPSGPDTVPTIPHAVDNPDPMVLRERPSVYFSGNATRFATKLAADKQCRLVCIPKFSQSGEAVLVNLKTLQVELLRFAD